MNPWHSQSFPRFGFCMPTPIYCLIVSIFDGIYFNSFFLIHNPFRTYWISIYKLIAIKKEICKCHFKILSDHSIYTSSLLHKLLVFPSCHWYNYDITCINFSFDSPTKLSRNRTKKNMFKEM